MSQDQWTLVDRYLNDLYAPHDAALSGALEATAEAGMPAIGGGAEPGQACCTLLALETRGARAILEIGTLGGYSTIWLARALPAGGRLVSLEYSAKHADVARSNLARAGLAEVAEVRVGPALESLPPLAAELAAGQRAPFDLVFIDADKENTPAYYDWALKLARRGSVIVVDNVVRDGAVIDEARTDAHIQGIRKFHRCHRGRAARDRDGDPDGGPEGLRRVHPRHRDAGLNAAYSAPRSGAGRA